MAQAVKESVITDYGKSPNAVVSMWILQESEVARLQYHMDLCLMSSV